MYFNHLRHITCSTKKAANFYNHFLLFLFIAHHSTILQYFGLAFHENEKQIGKKKLKVIWKKSGTFAEKKFDINRFSTRIFKLML